MQLVNNKPIRTRGGRDYTANKSKGLKVRHEDMQVPTALAKMMPVVPNQHGASDTARVAKASIYFPNGTGEETVKDYLIPRKSLTRQQHLNIFPVTMEVEARSTRQLDKLNGNMVGTTDNRVVWKSDRTLLRKGNPFSYPTDFKRETSRTKAIKHDPDTPFKGGTVESPVEDMSDLGL